MVRKIFLIFIAVAFFGFLIFGGMVAVNYVKIKKATAAVVRFPFQVGLTGVVMVPCLGALKCPTPMCDAKHMGSCPLPTQPPVFWDITGVSAGGDGAEVVLSSVVTTKIGLIPGGSLIAGGIAPTMMDAGVAASVLGVAGNTAFRLATFTDKAKDKIANFFQRF